MNFAEIMDFSRESRFQEHLLGRIKAECFCELAEDDLALVNAAGEFNPTDPTVVIMPQEKE